MKRENIVKNQEVRRGFRADHTSGARKATAKVGHIIPQEHVQNNTVEQRVDTPVPPFKEEIVEVGKTNHNARARQGFCEQGGEIP